MEEYIISTEYDGKPRKMYPVCCPCGDTFYAPSHTDRKYCSKLCAKKYRPKAATVTVICSYCGKDIVKRLSKLEKSKTKTLYCDRICKEQAQRRGGDLHVKSYNRNIEAASSYRVRGLEQGLYECASCGYKENINMIDVHHIDEDRSHNQNANLVCLCVWCHALVTRKVKRLQDLFPSVLVHGELV